MRGVANQQDILNIEKQPLFLAESTYDLLSDSAKKHSQKPALSFFLQTDNHKKPETYTYHDLLGKVNQTANFFNELGADKDTVIAYILPNLPETHFVIWGGEATGIVAAINPLLEADAIAKLLQAAEAKILVTLAPFPGTDLWQKTHQIIDQLPSLEHLVLVNITDHLTGIKKPLAKILQYKDIRKNHGSKGVRGAIPKQIKIHDFKQSIKRQNVQSLNSRRVFNKNDYSSFFCTGGTTGLPKIAMRRHINEVSNVIALKAFMGSSIKEGKNVFCGLPLFHVNAVCITGLLPFSQGAHVILGTPQGYRGEGVVSRFWEIVDTHKVNFFSGVPTLYASLLDVPVANHDISTLEYGLCGAAPMPLEILKRFESTTGLKILEGYGLTEGNCVSSVNPPLGESRLGSIGIRLPGQKMKTVLINEQGQYERDCEPQEIGNIVISGDNIFSGYKEASQNKDLWVDCQDKHTWMNTGDLGYQDKDGYFWLTGRKKELIIRGGHNIDPASIEEPLHEHPAIHLAAAVPRPDVYSGEVPVAYVELKPGVTTDSATLLEYAQTSIAERAAIPKDIKIVSEIPLTPVGKIFKPDLKKLEIQHSIKEKLDENNIPIDSFEVNSGQNNVIHLDIKLKNHQQKADAQKVLEMFTFKYDLA